MILCLHEYHAKDSWTAGVLEKSKERSENKSNLIDGDHLLDDIQFFMVSGQVNCLRLEKTLKKREKQTHRIE